MKKYSLIAFIGVIFLLCIFLFISSCKKEDKEGENVNQIPTCTITNPIEGQQIAKGETVIVSVEAKDTDGTIDEVQFSIDGIGRGSAGNFPYNYSWNTSDEAPGVHTIKATAIDNAGAEKTDQVTVEIIEGGSDLPVAAFTGSPTSGTAPLTVNFTDQSANNPTSWQWNFGDGGSSTQQNPAHTYSSAGTYTVELVASNTYGSDTEIKNNIIIVTTGGGTGQPCPGIPSFTYQGQTYNTVLIGSQCWMKENLNYATGDSWCYDDDPAYCNTYGRLYDWATIMNGEASSNSVPSGVQGICPDGWHVPSDEEWKILEGTVDSQYGVGDPEWDGTYWRGYKAGKNLKSTNGWYSNGNGTDLYGFAALPGGDRGTSGSFYGLSDLGSWWSSTEGTSSDAWRRGLHCLNDRVFRLTIGKTYGFSLRCLRD